MLKRTALFEEHHKLGGRLIDFGGWELPVQYTGVIDEHLACRAQAGLFDVSHMGEIHVEGADAELFLNYLVSNNISKTSIGQAQYTVMCNERGGVVDDLIIYRRSHDRFLVVVNASNTLKDFMWMEKILKDFTERELNRSYAIRMTHESANYTQIAIQGPRASEILQKLTQTALVSIKNYWFKEGFVLEKIPALLARTGYTGEDGFEIYLSWDQGPVVWRALMAAGKDLGIKPCGLGCRDTLRLEMKYPLYGHELGEETNPLEAGLGWVVKTEKGPFVGRPWIVQSKEQGLKRELIGLKLLERGIPRQGYFVFASDGQTRVGTLTSGTQSPSLKYPIGIALVDKPHGKTGNRLKVEIRGSLLNAEVIPTPFYKRPY
jgi:aminomethyltransferase